MASYRYHYSRYNRYDVIRVNTLTIAAVLFLSRHVLTFIVIGIAFSRAAPQSKGAFGGMFEPIFMAADIPAILVLLAMLSRHPKSGQAIRAIWRAGPYLLLASAVIYTGLIVREIWAAAMPVHWPVWLMIAGTAVSCAYPFLSPYARDLFRQFPDRKFAEDEKNK